MFSEYSQNIPSFSETNNARVCVQLHTYIYFDVLYVVYGVFNIFCAAISSNMKYRVMKYEIIIKNRILMFSSYTVPKGNRQRAQFNIWNILLYFTTLKIDKGLCVVCVWMLFECWINEKVIFYLIFKYKGQFF